MNEIFLIASYCCCSPKDILSPVIGLPDETPTWVNLHDISEDLQTLTVPQGVVGKWSIGSRIVITSTSRSYWEDHVRTIVRVDKTGESGLALLRMDSPLPFRPTTKKESSVFAVEVALLSRNILFEGESDDSSQTGHFIVFRTPEIIQKIEGVEFRHFGQQGVLGRYPIHFHFCGDVAGSVVAKNTIHLSQQRCVVVHGTDNLKISENVAYHTAGHCFMTEDVSHQTSWTG